MKNLSDKKVFFAASVVSLGSFLFGFCTAVISGALLYITDEFVLGVFQKSLLVSILILGAVIGAFLGGGAADSFGRKKALFLASFLFVIGGVLSIFGPFTFLVFGRLVQGLGVGAVSSIVPLYLAEISKVKHRGVLVSFNQLLIVFGVVIAYVIDYFFISWRYMVGFSLIPSIFFMFGLFFIPESPCYEKKYEKNLSKKLGNIFLENKAAFLIGIGISVIQQITGINVITYYAPSIFKMIHTLDHSQAILISLLIGSVQFFLTIVAMFFIDKIGRKKLLMIGMIGMGISFLSLGFFYKHPFVGIFSIISYVGFFAMSLGPITWVLVSEIFPLEIRGKAIGIAALFNWGCNYFVSFSFLPAIHFLGVSKTFYLFAGITFLSYWFVQKKVPETKDKSFEKIQEFFKK